MIHWFLKPAMQCIKLEEVNLSPKSSVFRFNIKWICMRGSGSSLYERCKVSSLEWIVNSDVINWYTLINSPLLFSVIFDCVCIFKLRDEIYSLRVLCFVLFFFGASCKLIWWPTPSEQNLFSTTYLSSCPPSEVKILRTPL